jgi:hypothetical protein
MILSPIQRLGMILLVISLRGGEWLMGVKPGTTL